MDDTSYVDLDLLVEQAGKKFRARVLASPVGPTTPIDFPPPIRKETLQIFVLTVGRPRQGVRRIDSPVEQQVKDLGGRLYRSIFRDQIRDCLRESEREARRQGSGLRVRLHLDGASSDLPWEFLFDEARQNFLSLSRMTPVVRYLDIDDVPTALKLDPPLRVLGVVSSPKDYPPLDVEGEWARLQRALSGQVNAGVVEVALLPTATVDELLQALQRGTYHVLHFIGHGGFRESSDEGVLLFEDDLGGSHEVTGEELGILLQDHPSLRLVVLNSCEGARAGVGDPFSGTAQSLVRRRIPAVVAMQFEITDTAALRFSQSFYGALAGNLPVDAAVAESRKSIRLSGNNFEWGTPVLYMLSPDGRLFELPKEAEGKAREAAEQAQNVQPPVETDEAARERERRERLEQERLEQERLERERLEQERLERERLEQARLEMEGLEHQRLEHQRLEHQRLEHRYVIAASISAVALIVGALGYWGTPSQKHPAFERTAGLIFAEPNPPPKGVSIPWFASVGLILVIVAVVVVLMAVRRRWVIVGSLGALAIVITCLFIYHYYDRSLRNQKAPEPLPSSVGYGEWLVIAAGIAIGAIAILAIRSARTATRPPAPIDSARSS